ncbi:MAG: TIR domain-containing protein [Candidatus Thiodiazotropha sp.]
MKEFDAAVFLLSPDDLMVKKERELNQPRDNVLFEIGLLWEALAQRMFGWRCHVKTSWPCCLTAPLSKNRYI